MKTIKLFPFLTAILLLISCSDDQATLSNVDASKMMGEWNLETIDYEGFTKIQFGGSDLIVGFNGVSTESDAVISFNANKSYSTTGTYEISLNTDIVDYLITLSLASNTGNWSLDGDKIQFSDGLVKLSTGQETARGPSELIINEITSNKMVLLFTYEAALNQNGFNHNVNLSGRYVLTK